MTDMRAQIINISLNYGLHQRNPNENSVIFKPFEQILTTGGETGIIKFLFLNTDKDLSAIPIDELNKIVDTIEFLNRIPPNNVKFFGCLCCTRNNFILFYPGIRSTYLKKYSNQEVHKHVEDIDINHFTLEPSFKKWHITHEDGKERGYTTEYISDNLVHWFSISINENVSFEQVYTTNTFGRLIPVPDADRRIRDIQNSLQAREEIIITAPIVEGYQNNNCFRHFEFYINTDFSHPSPELTIRHVPIHSANLGPLPESIPFISYTIDFPNSNFQVIILGTTFFGNLDHDIIISYPS